MEKSVFAVLNAIDCKEHIEKKNGLSYLSWAWAWAEVKKAFPSANYTIYENKDGWNYFTDGRTCWVKTGVTIEGLEHIEELPVMDFRNASIPFDKVTSFDINKSIQRSLTKACARHGLGLYIYAGEDLPETCPENNPFMPEPQKTAVETRRAVKTVKKPAQPVKTDEYKPIAVDLYWKIIEKFSKGIPAKSGCDYRMEWVSATNAGKKEIQQFNDNVMDYCSSNGLPLPKAF